MGISETLLTWYNWKAADGENNENIELHATDLLGPEGSKESAG